MNDEETVALIVGGHTFGKCHGAGDAELRRARSPRAARSSAQGLGWKNTLGSGKGVDAITSGLEGAWTNDPTKWDNGFLENLFGYEWELTDEPGRREAVDAEEPGGAGTRCPTRTTRRSGTRR